METTIKAVLWDFGGVILTSPFEALNRYEAERGLPRDIIRRINSTNPLSNAWARMERGELSVPEFSRAYREESAAIGHAIDGAELLPLLAGDIQEVMVEGLRRVRTRFRVACLTNNIRVGHGPSMSATPEKAARLREVLALFELVLESSRLGARKPELVFYERACEAMGVQPQECVFLDDLGINLKPAAAMGMRTIKVTEPRQALRELGGILRMELL